MFVHFRPYWILVSIVFFFFLIYYLTSFSLFYVFSTYFLVNSFLSVKLVSQGSPALQTWGKKINNFFFFSLNHHCNTVGKQYASNSHSTFLSPSTKTSPHASKSTSLTVNQTVFVDISKLKWKGKSWGAPISRQQCISLLKGLWKKFFTLGFSHLGHLNSSQFSGQPLWPGGPEAQPLPHPPKMKNDNKTSWLESSWRMGAGLQKSSVHTSSCGRKRPIMVKVLNQHSFLQVSKKTKQNNNSDLWAERLWGHQHEQ